MLERLEDCLNPLSRSVISLGKVTFFSFRSIRLHKATVSYYYYEILIQLLTRSSKLYTLHQLIQVGPSPPPPIPTLHSPPPPIPTLHSPPPPYLHSTHHIPPYMRSTHHLPQYLRSTHSTANNVLAVFQFNVVGDSLPLAYLLLSLTKVYTPAFLLGLDMLKR